MRKESLAEKNRKMRKILEKAGLPSVPKDPKTGKMITAGRGSRKLIRRTTMDRRIFYLCPKCGKTLLFGKISHAGKCVRCGQRIDWSEVQDIRSLYILAETREEAAFWADKYEEIAGTSYGIDIEKWRRELGGFPVVLFFPFLDGKEYGRFMRLAAKEAKIVKEP